MANRIRTLRERLGLSLESLAGAVGTDRSTIWRYETGRTPLMNDGAVKIAKALALNRPEELLADVVPQQLRIAGYVGAGAEEIPLDDQTEEIAAPAGFVDGFALRVRGSSMTPAYREGDILFARVGQFSAADLLGRDCIVQVDDGPRLVKRVLTGNSKGFYRLFSYEDQSVSEEVKLLSAAPVEWVRRR